MKRVFRNSICMLIISWCFILNGLGMVGTLLSLLNVTYVLYVARKLNYWRMSLVFFLGAFLSLALTFKSGLIRDVNQFFVPFMVLVSLGIALLNEMLYKLKAKTITPYYSMLCLALIAFGSIAVLIPDLSMLPNYKKNLFIYIALIFVPAFVSMTTALVYKNSQEKFHSLNQINIQV
ncbi:MAG: hypothetical protein Q4B60_04400 [Erysipelotrichaceae bacterium]|nr:hypothetical protein [Erysipelotrichaceae bacterium]